jgi:hypothetical protein
MIDTVRLGYFHRAVLAAVVDDQPFDGIETWHLARQGSQRNC